MMSTTSSAMTPMPTTPCSASRPARSNPKPDRMRMEPANSYYLKSAKEMRADFADYPDELIAEAFASSRKIADMTDIDLAPKGYHLPVFPVPTGYNEHSYLRHLIEVGMDWRYGADWRANDTFTERIERELNIIHSMGFDTYFLIVWDLCEFARHADIWWNVRGSGNASLVAYSLGISNIDPIENGLLFERFLNPGRVSMPDIDLDYPDDRRGEMIAYTARKYGEDKVAAIITFGTLGAKNAVRDVGRALDVDLAVIDRAARLIPQEARQKKIRDYVDGNAELLALYQADPDLQRVIDTAIELQGMTRHASTHAAGVIVADRPLVELAPLHRITGKDPSGGALKAVTQFPMETAESIGLLKVDFLGLSTLTILRKACELIARHRGIHYTSENIPYRHDPAASPEERALLDDAFDMMGRGDTIGVFQVESGGMQQMLRQMRPKVFENIVAGISLFRPGPMEFIDQYCDRMHGKEEITYLHPKLEPILAETYGIIVFQEQIMQIAGELFGYALGEADLMRRAVSKKKPDDLNTHKAIFMQRGPENGVDAETAEEIFEMIEFFANYGFNKPHAADYAVITVQTAYLKCHYQEEYMTALLSVQRDDLGKVSTYLEECRRLNIPILPPDINHSQLDFDIERGADGKRAIRFGLAAIKNAGAGALEELVAQRGEAPFESLIDFCVRVDMRKLGKRTLESLIKVGALERFGTRATLLAALDGIVSYSSNYHRDLEVGQMIMFGESAASDESLLKNLKRIEEHRPRELLRWEKELVGFYLSGRPVERYREVFSQQNLHKISDLKNPSLPTPEAVRIAGEITAIRQVTTRNGDQMAVLSLEDWHDSAGLIEVVLFPRTYENTLHTFARLNAQAAETDPEKGLDEGEIVMIAGRFDDSRAEPQVVAEKVIVDFNSASAAEPAPEPPADDEPPWADMDEAFPAAPPESAAALTRSAPEPAPPDNPEAQTTAEPDREHDEPDEPQPEWTNGDGKLHMPGEEPARERPPRFLTVILATSDDPDTDRRKLERIHSAIVKFPGPDRFTIVIRRGDASTPLNFPDQSTLIGPDLKQELLAIVEHDEFIQVTDNPQ